MTGMARGDEGRFDQQLEALGVGCEQLSPAADGSPVLRVRPPQRFTAAPQGIDCGLAGTVMRFVPPMAALAGGSTAFFGDPRAGERPMGPVLDRQRMLRVPLAPGAAAEIRSACPPAEGSDADLAVARALIDNPTAWQAALGR